MTTSAAKANRRADIVDRLEAENERLQKQNEELKQRLAKYEPDQGR